MGLTTLAGTMRHTDPPNLGRVVLMSPKSRRADVMLRTHLAERVETCGDKAVKSKIRSFLRAFQSATSHGNPSNIVLQIARGPGAAYTVYGCVHGGDRVPTLPVIVMPSSPSLVNSYRESCASVVPIGEPRVTLPDGDGEQRRRIPPKVETTLIPGRKPW